MSRVAQNQLLTHPNSSQQKYANAIKPVRHNGHQLLVTLLLANMIVNETLPVISDQVLGGGVQAVVVSTVLIIMCVSLTGPGRRPNVSQFRGDHPPVNMYALWSLHRSKVRRICARTHLVLRMFFHLCRLLSLTCRPGHCRMACRKAARIHSWTSPRHHLPARR